MLTREPQSISLFPLSFFYTNVLIETPQKLPLKAFPPLGDLTHWSAKSWWILSLSSGRQHILVIVWDISDLVCSRLFKQLTRPPTFPGAVSVLQTLKTCLQCLFISIYCFTVYSTRLDISPLSVFSFMCFHFSQVGMNMRPALQTEQQNACCSANVTGHI